MLTLETKLYILKRLFEEEVEEIVESELLLTWGELEDLDNEEFYEELKITDEDRESVITLIFGYNDVEFIEFIGGYQELNECSKDFYMESIQDFLISLFTYAYEKPVTRKEILINKLDYHLSLKIVYPFKDILLKSLSPIIKKHYGIKELPFCMATIPIKDWKNEFAFQWLIENEDELEEI